jgi:hypothetical protein
MAECVDARERGRSAAAGESVPFPCGAEGSVDGGSYARLPDSAARSRRAPAESNTTVNLSFGVQQRIAALPVEQYAAAVIAPPLRPVLNNCGPPRPVLWARPVRHAPYIRVRKSRCAETRSRGARFGPLTVGARKRDPVARSQAREVSRSRQTGAHQAHRRHRACARSRAPRLLAGARRGKDHRVRRAILWRRRELAYCATRAVVAA